MTGESKDAPKVETGNKKPVRFGGLTPQEAGRKGGQAKRRRRDEAAQAAKAGIVVTADDRDGVIKALKDKALRGDVPSARELREWIEIQKEGEGETIQTKSVQRFIGMFSPELRDAMWLELEEGKPSERMIELRRQTHMAMDAELARRGVRVHALE